VHCLCAGEFLSWHWTCGADSTWGQVQPHTTTARWYVLSAVCSHSRPSKNGMLLDVIQYAMWQSVPDFWHRTVACVTRYSHVVDWSDCWSMMHLYSCQNCRLCNTLQSCRGLVWLLVHDAFVQLSELSLV